MKLGNTLILGLALCGAMAFADDCDYVGRHYNTDLVPLKIEVTNVPRSGDIGGFQSLRVLVGNYGSQPVPGVTGMVFPAKGLRIRFNLHRKIGTHYIPVTKTMDGSLTVPMAGGSQQWVGFSLPTNYITNCSSMSMTIDYTRTVGQHGCQVFENDTKSFRVRIPGGGFCRR